MIEYHVTFRLRSETFRFTLEAMSCTSAKSRARDLLWEKHKDGELTLLDYDRCVLESVSSTPQPKRRTRRAKRNAQKSAAKQDLTP